MMNSRAIAIACAASACVMSASISRAAVMLNFGGSVPATTSTTVAVGGAFTFDVYVNETAAADRVSSINYTVTSYKAAATVSNAFQINGRTQNATQSSNLAPYATALTTKNLAPNYVGNLGGDAPTATDLAGVANRDTATYSVQLLSAATVGTYTFQFTAPSGAALTYAGARDTNGNATDAAFASTNTFTVNVVAAPEPASLVAASAALGAFAFRRRRVAR